MYKHVHGYMGPSICVCELTHVQRVNTRAHTHICSRMAACGSMYMCVHMCMQYTRVSVHMCGYARCAQKCVHTTACVKVDTWVCVCIQMRMYLCLGIRAHDCACASTPVCREGARRDKPPSARAEATRGTRARRAPTGVLLDPFSQPLGPRTHRRTAVRPWLDQPFPSGPCSSWLG